MRMPPSALAVLVTLLGPLAAPGRAQVEPLLRIDEEVVAAAFALDGRIVFATRRIISRDFYMDKGREKIDMRRDDVWLTGLDGKKKRIVDGERLVRGNVPYSYAIQSIRWSPDGTRMTVEMLTSVFVDRKGNTQEGALTLLLDQTGKEIKIQGADSVIPGGLNSTWLSDSVTVAFLSEAVEPRLLWAVGTVRPVSGLGNSLFKDQFFAAVAWDARRSAAVAVERDRQLKHSPELVALDLRKETRRVLMELPAYFGGLSLSPSGQRVAYFRDAETLEVREVTDPQRAARVRVVYGAYIWSADETRILIKSGDARKSGPLTWITLPALGTPDASTAAVEATRTPALRGLTFRDFTLSPDGKYLAVTEPGGRSLLIYPAQ